MIVRAAEIECSAGRITANVKDRDTMATKATRAQSNTASVFIGRNVPSDATGCHHPSWASERFRDKPPSEDEYLAALWLMQKPKTAHDAKLNAARYAADVIRYRRAIGEHERACAYAAPIEEAMAGLSCGDAAKREEIADAQEDVAQGMYRAEPSKQALQALLRARANMRQSSIDHDRELIANAPKEWEVSL